MPPSAYRLIAWEPSILDPYVMRKSEKLLRSEKLCKQLYIFPEQLLFSSSPAKLRTRQF